MSGNDTDHHKVPIWIGSDCKLVTGINKSTTCQHIIQSLVRTENPSKFVIVEKWKKMERKLDPTVRILKVWKAWGDQKDDVALILRHHHSTDGYIDKRISNKVLRRNKSSQHHKLSNHDENSMEEVEVTEPMERLLKLVLTQGETIQAQLKKLRHQEEQIERYEEQMHRLRSLQEGENYVVESYLRDDKGKKIRKRDKSPRKSGWLKQQQQQNDQPKQLHHHQHQPNQQQQQSKSSTFHHHSSNGESKGNNGTTTAIGSCQSETIVQTRLEKGENGRNINNSNSRTAEDAEEEDDEATTMATTAVDIHEQNELMERICDLNKKLTKEEEHLVKLGLKIKKIYEKHKDCERLDVGDGTEENHERKKKAEQEQQQQYLSEQSQKEEEEEELRQLISQLEALRDVTNEQFSEIEMNEKSLNEMEQLLDVKHDHVAHLTYQIQLVDEESEQLRQRLLKVSQGFPQNSYNHHPHFLHPQYPPQYSAIPNSSYYPYPSNQYPYQQQQYGPEQQLQSQQQQQYQQQQLLENSIAVAPGTSANAIATSSVTGTGIIGESDEMPTITSHYHHHHLHQQQQQHTEDILTQHQLVPHNQPLVSSSNSDTVSNMNLGCQQVENISSTTTLNLHIKPCRDHQDNDSNSDTGISSLHSSSDENTLFVLDTLV